MSKRQLNWDENKLERFLKEGRGQGIGNSYKPWKQIQDYPSLGVVSRVFGWKTQRIHHFFTNTESRYFYLLEWQDNVIDIQEHYPLLNIEDVIKEREDLRFDLFKDKESGTNYVLSTTFLITLKDRNGREIFVARSIKSSTELAKKITLEKLEIERRYWENKNIDYRIVTQKEIPLVRCKNIEWVHSTRNSYKDRRLTEDEMLFLCDAFLTGINEENNMPVRKYASIFDKEYKQEDGIGLFLFKYLIAVKIIQVDIDKEIGINDSIGNFKIIQNEKG